MHEGSLEQHFLATRPGHAGTGQEQQGQEECHGFREMGAWMMQKSFPGPVAVLGLLQALQLWWGI